MNTAQLKVISWGAALLFGAGLAAYVGNYLVHRADLEQRVAREQIQGALAKVPNVEKRAEDIVAYERVNEALFKLNWTAKPPAKPPPPPTKEDTGPIGPVKVSTLLSVLFFKADATDDSGSHAVIKYLSPAQVKIKAPTVVKHIGDTLDEPWESITVSAITHEGVRFKFADANRAEELVGPNEFTNRLDMEALANLGTGALIRPPEILIRKGPNFGTAPARTYQNGTNEWVIGTEDMLGWEENYERYLAEVELDRHRDPSTGKYDGIKLSSVPGGSIAAQYGAKEGDVVKSINDHPVNSTQEAISFVKNNKDKYDVWVVVIESKGKTKTVTYKVPKKK